MEWLDKEEYVRRYVDRLACLFIIYSGLSTKDKHHFKRFLNRHNLVFVTHILLLLLLLLLGIISDGCGGWLFWENCMSKKS